MSYRTPSVALSLVVAVAVVAGQSQSLRPPAADVPAEARWKRAVDAWAAGSYSASLEDLRTLMRSPSAAEYVDRVALLTGELFVTTELAADGRNPKVSADGRFASYETGAAQDAVTRLVRVGPKPQVVADLRTTSVAFDRSGRQLAWLRTGQANDPKSTEIVVRDLSSGTERVILPAGLQKASLAWAADGQSVLFIGGDEADPTRTDVYAAREGAAPIRLTDQPGHKSNVLVDSTGTALVYTATAASPFTAGRGGPGAGRAGGAGGGRGGPATPPTYGVVNLAAKTARTVSGTALTLSADGSTIAWLSRTGEVSTLNVSSSLTDQTTAVRSGRERIDAPALSPDGKLVAYQLMTHTDWEIYLSDRSGTHRRLTRDIQHDLLPRFLTNDTLLGLMGEARHRRSHLYDVSTGTRTRLFANNSIRTISPEYIWASSANGKYLIVQADRDGDTVSTERSVSVVDLTQKISSADLLARLDRQLAGESGLVQRMTQAFKPVDALARQVVARATVNRVYEYQKALFDFDSKYITQPGNARAIEYLEKTYRSFGYQPELQWFQPQQLQAGGGRTANVVATLRGTENPELIYVVSSHFDSVAGGPGADDDTSGTAALLEASRILAPNPLPVTVVFASFTGEEAGLLGSREFVRRAAEGKWNVVGALNNDMIGWGGESSRMDNTIRYSNAGIKDLQHGAAFLFTNLITYDAKYYRGTDAAAFYEAWGDIVGGIGSYPVLANPNYHQPTDFLETMNHRQIMETAKVTAATLVYLASSPSRLKNLQASKTAAGVELTWAPSPEAGIKSYIVTYGPANEPMKERITVAAPSVTLPALAAGTHVAVKAINSRGLEGWDWARTVIQLVGVPGPPTIK